MCLTISSVFSGIIIFFSNKYACDFGPRMISSSFFGVLFQIVWKDAKIVDCRFSVMSPRKHFELRGFNIESQCVFRFNNFSDIFQNSSVITT